MEKQMKINAPVVFSRETNDVTIRLTLQQAGPDLLILLTGGESPHIGSVIAATPRSSLRGTGTSATSSVVNRSGHYDEVPGRRVAERLAATLNTYVVCVCGIHVDEATPEVINNILSCCDLLAVQAQNYLLQND